MSLSSIRSSFRFYTSTATLSIAIVLIFSSWGKAPSAVSLREAAGANAFRKTVTSYQLMIQDKPLAYQASAGYITVNDGEYHSAKLFYTAYTSGKSDRPLTFIFNGGPGSSSIWLHMGALAPVRVKPGKQGYRDNPDTWLNFTDLVFIDPVGTGYSRPEDGTNASRFYSYNADIQSIGDFIRRYLTENGRQHSPLFLAGESYGAARAVGLATYLQGKLQTPVTGLTLISPALDYRLISFRKGNDIPYPYYLPAYAVAAQYHHRLSSELQALTADELQKRVSLFAFGTYRNALAGHVALSQEVLDTLHNYTGLDTAALKRLNGRVTDVEFTHLLLGNQHYIIGTYDSRDAGNDTHTDPSEQRLRAVFPQAFQQYISENLHYDNQLPYLATIATPDWNYGAAEQKGYLNVIPLLNDLLKRYPGLNVHIVNGTYDLATPAATVDAAVKQLNRAHLWVHHYQAGHMLYADNEVNKLWHNDSETFYRKAG